MDRCEKKLSSRSSCGAEVRARKGLATCSGAKRRAALVILAAAWGNCVSAVWAQAQAQAQPLPTLPGVDTVREQRKRLPSNISIRGNDPAAFSVNVTEVLACRQAQANCGGHSSLRDWWRVKIRLQTQGEPDEFQVSEQPGFTGAGWQPFRSEIVYTLSAGIGTKTIFIRTRKALPTPGSSLATTGRVPARGNTDHQEINAAGRRGPASLETPAIDPARLREQATNVAFANTSVEYALNGTIRIASVGESYAAGEGAPDSGTGDDATTSWQSQQCHRSARNGRALAARELQERLGDSVDVIFGDFACSGASVYEGLLGEFVGAPDIRGRAQDPLPSQISQVRDWLGSEPLDILLLSIGGNDVGFAEAISKCLNPLAPLGCQRDPELTRTILMGDPSNAAAKIGFAGLQDAYAELAAVIDRDLAPGKVLITEYPDPTRGEDGETCGCKWPTQPEHMVQAVMEDGVLVYDCYDDDFAVIPQSVFNTEGDIPVTSRGVRTGFDRLGVSFGGAASYLWADETRWIRDTILLPLNQQVRRAASRHGWGFVGGMMEATRLHGLCAAPQERWFNTLRDSWERQGDIRGAVHPNATGYRAYERQIMLALEEIVPL